MEKGRKLAFAYLLFIQVLGAALGGVIAYASDHPKTEIYKVLVNLGFHFSK